MKRQNIAHSEILQYAAESGFPAALLVAGLAVYFFVAMGRRLKTSRPEARFIQAAAFLTVAGAAAHGLVDNNLSVPIMASVLAVASLADIPLGRTSVAGFRSGIGFRVAVLLVRAPLLSLHIDSGAGARFQPERT